jgi:hypothetical protein
LCHVAAQVPGTLQTSPLKEPHHAQPQLVGIPARVCRDACAASAGIGLCDECIDLGLDVSLKRYRFHCFFIEQLTNDMQQSGLEPHL